MMVRGRIPLAEAAGGAAMGASMEATETDFREVIECICLRMRRAARRVTQIYDHALEPIGITVNQFGLLAQLAGVRMGGSDGLSIGILAERLGTDPTTLNRTLKPLEERGLVRSAFDPADARLRLLEITQKGQRELGKAMPLWHQAQDQLQAALGIKSLQALGELLDLSVTKLAPVQ
jgi:DNA-binding MarR family transcriptional regulator